MKGIDIHLDFVPPKKMESFWTIQVWYVIADHPKKPGVRIEKNKRIVFVTNKTIRDTLAKSHAVAEMGRAVLTYTPRYARLTWSDFYPFSSVKGLNFERRGTAQLVEYLTLYHIGKQFPEVQTIEHVAPGPARERQILRRETPGLRLVHQVIHESMEYPFANALKALRTKIGRDSRKAKHHPSPHVKSQPSALKPFQERMLSIRSKWNRFIRRIRR